MPARKRKTTYPPPRNAAPRPPRPGEPGGPGSPGSDVPYQRSTVASINLSAGAGRAGLTVGDRVRITGNGLYSGELATIDKLTSGVIPSAVVRTDAGRTRQVRTIDLEPVAAPPPVPQPGAAAPAPAASPSTPPRMSASPDEEPPAGDR
ncbi:MAG TPA: hypothetical protein VFP22_00475 [Candidatus Limnocylindrales bacterium]|nr:hypothetical protein [Candidatus Limnocylindrales bacterium]